MAPMNASEAPPLILVVAAVVVRDGRVLLSRRARGTHLAGHWEFPGGKVEPGEDPPSALRREVLEELGVACDVDAPFAFNHHAYPERRVLLITYRARLHGEPRALDGEEIAWFGPEAVRRLTMPPADGPIVDRLLPILEAG